ncbi:MATE family efflux transporter [Porphyromonas sp. COT-290 OH3588]|uniref:MATE family efflux transporter n=1 Tax=Porphyromonas sp. COT-290 OH3588 TaxID=1515617 RepID=UPI00052C6EC8|nr:MATE family efflux transporter [Porphyromonas sp. COT-290 OH3588]KGN98830.1 multidrug transporter MatE [Porphyromonas sp. COT-290 OH3588]
MDRDERIYKLEHESIGALLLHYGVPAVVGTMVTALYNIVDRIFIGQGVGEYAIAGLTLTFPILIFLQAFGMLVGAGTAARVSILLGQKDIVGAERVLGTAIVLTLITQAMTIIPSLIWMRPLLEAFGGSERTIPYAMDYLSITIPGNIFATLCFSYNAVMRASGYPRKAMYTMILGAVLNTLLDALFIYGFGWGIAGAAWATVVAMLISAIYVLSHFFSADSIIRFRREHLRVSWGPMWAIASIGLSPFAVQLLGSLVSMLFNKSFIAVSPTPEAADIAIGSYGIIVSIAMLGVMLMLGIAQGMQPIVGYNYGARLYGRVQQAFWRCAWVNIAIGLLVTVFSVWMPDFISSIFTQSPLLIAETSRSLSIALVGFAFVGFQITATQFLQSLGIARRAFLLSISRQSLFFIPLLLILPYQYGVDGVWYSGVLADILSGLLGIGLIIWQMRQFRVEGF